MAEALGVAASAVTLAGLFTNCIECFHYFKAAQNCPEEAERMLVKLDCEKARLLVWANTIGLLDANVRGRDPRLAHPSLEDVLRRAIDQVIRLLTDAQDLQTKYGGRPTVESEKQRYLAIISANAMNVFTTSKRRFFARAGAPSQKPPMSSRLKWAVRDAARFKILLVDLQGFVDNIIQLVQVEPKAINMVIEEDITSMVSISNLRLTEEACEETYPSWSSKASEVIRDSELGTTDRRNREEFLRDVDEQETSTRSEADFADQIAFTGKSYTVR